MTDHTCLEKITAAKQACVKRINELFASIAPERKLVHETYMKQRRAALKACPVCKEDDTLVV